MAKPAPDAAVVLQILADRIVGVPAEETARKHGYRPKTISDIARRYKLDEIEHQLRTHITGQAAELSPDAIALNEKCDERLDEISELLYAEVKALKPEEGQSEFEPPTLKDRIARVGLLELAARGLESTRQARMKITCATTDAKKKQAAKEQKPEDGFKSDYADLANDDGDENEAL
ncbi:MAG: hypothetical protein CVV27_08475 [Candidatus Melainabacteria bacterium HGW-Melainabacteria-1]|nr:MAG: hypothetical protein CVV27_08475 [Candidatus Melainabacteria bacterium HGW-Melainabacteria-1]